MPDSALFFELLYWFGVLVSAGFGNPVPEEIIITLAGMRAAQMGEDYPLFRWLLLPVCIAGALIADIVLYGLGRLFGARLFRTRLLSRIAPPEKRERIRVNFDRYGVLIFIVGRLVPGIRITLFLTAGTLRLSLTRFVVADGLGALFGASLFFFLGFGLGASFKDIIEDWENRIMAYKSMILLALLVLVGGYLAYAFLRHPISTGDPKEVPLIGPQIAAAIQDPHATDDPGPAGNPLPADVSSRTGG